MRILTFIPRTILYTLAALLGFLALVRGQVADPVLKGQPAVMNR